MCSTVYELNLSILVHLLLICSAVGLQTEIWVLYTAPLPVPQHCELIVIIFSHCALQTKSEYCVSLSSSALGQSDQTSVGSSSPGVHGYGSRDQEPGLPTLPRLRGEQGHYLWERHVDLRRRRRKSRRRSTYCRRTPPSSRCPPLGQAAKKAAESKTLKKNTSKAIGIVLVIVSL